MLHSFPSYKQLTRTPDTLLSTIALHIVFFSGHVVFAKYSISLFKRTDKVIDYFPETCRENMIFRCSATWACISCLQIVICWQGLCHDTTHLSLPSAAGEQQLFFWCPQICCSKHIVSFCIYIIIISKLLDVFDKGSHFRWHKVRPWTVNIPRFINSPARLFLLSCRLLSFVVLPAFGRDACLWDQTWGNEMLSLRRRYK